ncbi:hypothetical protein J6590_033647 [Homalodisca vitripennis]|nr:hypothetical protein J6590_033647 [Homalodisca vitripennis]
MNDLLRKQRCEKDTRTVPGRVPETEIFWPAIPGRSRDVVDKVVWFTILATRCIESIQEKHAHRLQNRSLAQGSPRLICLPENELQLAPNYEDGE